MPNQINLGQFMEFDLTLTNQGPQAMYRLFANEGYRYAKLAMGVAEQNTLSGVVALSYMKSTGAAMGKSTDDEVVNKILNEPSRLKSLRPFRGQASLQRITRSRYPLP